MRRGSRRIAPLLLFALGAGAFLAATTSVLHDAPAPVPSAATRPADPIRAIDPAPSPGGVDEAVETIRRLEYLPSLQDRDALGARLPQPALHFVNRAHELRAYFEPARMTIQPREARTPGWSFALEPAALSREGVRPPERRSAPAISGERVVYQRPWGEEWYVNGERGLEQAFLVRDAPPGTGPVRLAMRFSGLEAGTVGPDRAVFAAHGERVLECRELVVRDARGRELPSWIELTDGALAFAFRDEHAAYPVTVDPWFGIGALLRSPRFGSSVCGADVNGDGHADVIIGAPHYDTGQYQAGAVFAFRGTAAGLVTNAPWWSATGDEAYEVFGYAVANAGHVNGDAFDDLIVGAPGYRAGLGGWDTGAAYVYYGGSGGLLTNEHLRWQPSRASEAQLGAGFGASVSGAGDVDGDTYADVIVGEPEYTVGSNTPGRVSVYYGSHDGLGTREAYRWQKVGPAGLTARLGVSVASAGRFFGDSFAGTPVHAVAAVAPMNITGQGKVFVFRGSPYGLVTHESSPAIIEQPGLSFFGQSIANAGRVDGDEFDDLLVSEHGFVSPLGVGVGRVHLYTGAALSGTVDGPRHSILEAPDPQPGGQFGYAISAGADLDGDGRTDAVIGEPGWDRGAIPDVGRAFFFFGSANGLVPRASVPPSEGLASLDAFGFAVALVGDITGRTPAGRHISDVVVTAPQHAPEKPYETGIAYLSYGVGAPCTPETDCISGFCIDGVCCNEACGNGDPGDCQSCVKAGGADLDGVCKVLPTTWTCRPQAVECDAPENCDGASTLCPGDVSAVFEPCTADGNPCTEDLCYHGLCQHLPFGSGPCEDGRPCTFGDQCVSGVCTAGATIVCEDDPGPCGAKRSCNGTGTCAVTYPTGAITCDDGDPCTFGDRCNGAGGCAGLPVNCTSDQGPCGARRTCNGTSRCEVTVPLAGTPCDDGDPCSFSEQCNGAGACVGTRVTCVSDAPPCGARRACNGTSECTVTFPKGSCDDQNLCTHSDSCDGAGHCRGLAVDCHDEPTACGARRTCNGTASCRETWPTKGTGCDDGEACTYSDQCDGAGACRGTALACVDDAAPCGLRRACNGTAACAETWATEAAPCDDTDACTRSDHCDGAGSCVAEPYSCDDGNSCTTDVCNGDGSCGHASLPEDFHCPPPGPAEGADTPGLCHASRCVPVEFKLSASLAPVNAGRPYPGSRVQIAIRVSPKFPGVKPPGDVRGTLRVEVDKLSLRELHRTGDGAPLPEAIPVALREGGTAELEGHAFLPSKPGERSSLTVSLKSVDGEPLVQPVTASIDVVPFDLELEGCGCSTRAAPGPFAALALVSLALRARRRTEARS